MPTIFERIFGSKTKQAETPTQRQEHFIKGFGETVDLTEAYSKALLPGFRKFKMTKEIGEEHPYDFQVYENAYLLIPMIKGAIDTHVNYVMRGSLQFVSDNESGRTIVEKCFKLSSFDLKLRRILRDVLIYGNSFVEITWVSGKPFLKTLDPKFVFVKRDDYGEVIGYTQYDGVHKIDFTPDEVIHFAVDKVGDSAYGVSLLRPIVGNEKVSMLFQKLGLEEAIKIILSRKANAPYHVKIGSDLNPASSSDISDFASDLTVLKNRTEWVTSHLVDINVVGLGDKFINFVPFLEHYEANFIYALKIPHVMLGRANVPEGLAQAQMENLASHTKAVQSALEEVVVNKIIIPLLEFHGLHPKENDLDWVEIQWNASSEDEAKEDLANLVQALNVGTLSPGLRTALERKYAEVLGLPLDKIDFTPQQAVQSQPFNPFPVHSDQPLSYDFGEEDFNRIEFFGVGELKPNKYEWFSVSESVADSLKVFPFVVNFLKSYSFSEVSDLSDRKREALRKILIQAVEQKAGIGKATKQVAKLFKGDEVRAEAVVRTELSRSENAALVRAAVKSGVVKAVQFQTAKDERVDSECSKLEGRIFSLEEAKDMLPLHPNDRCTFIPILK